MKNFELKQMGVQEMDAVEKKNVDGGFLGVIIAGLIIGAGIEIMGDWDNFKKGLSDGWNAA